MKAIIQDRYGVAADVWQLKELPIPRPGPDKVLVRVHAAAVDVGVWHLLSGRPYLVRLMGFGFRGPKVKIPGLGLAGTVEAVGAAVTSLKPGDEVFGWCEGSFAEHIQTSPETLLPKPRNVTFEQAAAAPVSGITALHALQAAGVKAGQHVLITGAGGGVGSFAVQIAKAWGARVTGVCSPAKVEFVRSIGADEVVDYTRSDFTRNGQRYGAIIDTAGRRSLGSLRRALTPTGSLVLVGGEGGDAILGGFDRAIRAALLSRFVRQDLRMLMSVERKEDLAVLKDMIEAGSLCPQVDRAFPLAEAAAAIDHLHSGRPKGKVVLTM